MNRLLRVLHVITRLDRGGSAENTLLTVAGLDPDSFDVTVAVGPTAGDPSPTEAKARNRSVRFVHIPDLVRAPRPLRDLRDPQSSCTHLMATCSTDTAGPLRQPPSSAWSAGRRVGVIASLPSPPRTVMATCVSEWEPPRSG